MLKINCPGWHEVNLYQNGWQRGVWRRKRAGAHDDPKHTMLSRHFKWYRFEWLPILLGCWCLLMMWLQITVQDEFWSVWSCTLCADTVNAAKTNRASEYSEFPWPRPNWACGSLAKDNTASTKTHKQGATAEAAPVKAWQNKEGICNTSKY